MVHNSAIKTGFTVTNNTTLDQLKQYIDGAGKDGKLYAKKNGDEYTIYIKPEAKNSLEKIGDLFLSAFRFNSSRRENAREAIASVIDRTGQSLKSSQTQSVQSIGRLMYGLSENIKEGFGGSTSRALRLDDVRSKIETISNEISSSRPPQSWKEKISNALDSIGLGPKNAVELKAEDFPIETIKGVVTKQMLPVIVIDGNEYKPVKELGAGAFARVYRYESGDKALAVKVPNGIMDSENSYREIKALVREINASVDLNGKTPDSINSFVTAIPRPHNQVLVVSEIAAGGDMSGAIDKVKAGNLMKPGNRTRPPRSPKRTGSSPF